MSTQPTWPSDCMEAHDFRISFTPLAGVLFTVPSRYCALSVTACRLPWAVVRPASDRISRVRSYSGASPARHTVPYAAITRYGGVFQTPSSRHGGSGVGQPDPTAMSYNPVGATAGPLARQRFGLHPVRSPLLRVSFTRPPATEMFQFTGFPPPKWSLPEQGGCPIRKSWDQCVLAAPPGISVRCPVLHRHAAPGHPSCAHHVFPPVTAEGVYPAPPVETGRGPGRSATHTKDPNS